MLKRSHIGMEEFFFFDYCIRDLSLNELITIMVFLNCEMLLLELISIGKGKRTSNVTEL